MNYSVYSRLAELQAVFFFFPIRDKYVLQYFFIYSVGPTEILLLGPHLDLISNTL